VRHHQVFAGFFDPVAERRCGHSEPEAVAETIANNMRRVIIDERAMNPKYYDSMSELLDALIEEQRKEAIEYEEYLHKLIEAAKKLGAKESNGTYPSWADNGAKRALVDFFRPKDDVALGVDAAVRNNKPDSWVQDS